MHIAMTYPKPFPPKSRNAAKLIRVGVGLCLAGISLGSLAPAAQAEGSRTLYPSTANPATNYRANLEWRTDRYGGTDPASTVPRRSLMKVYAKAGEYILLGSSAVGINTGAGTGDIAVFDPGAVTGNVGNETIPATPNFLCSAQRPTATSVVGQIRHRDQELAGPKAASETTAVGTTPATAQYRPCYYQAPSTGIYDVIFYGPQTAQVTPTGEISLTNTNNFNNQQGTSVAAWDATVRSSFSSTTDINGRVFSYSMAMFTASNGRPVNFKLYPITNDGFRYELHLRDIDPNGFAVYGNQIGFWDSDGTTPLYHDILGSNDALATVSGGVKIAVPQFPLFLNEATDNSVIQSTQRYDSAGNPIGGPIPLTPIVPTVSGLTFTGNQSGNTSIIGSAAVGSFGNFTFNSNVIANYEIVISRDGINFDPTLPGNRSLRGAMASSSPSIPWDGKDNNGNFFPVGNNYPSRVTVKAGEYHFPILDAENSLGGATVTLRNATSPFGSQTQAFYDDRSYRTLAGTLIGTYSTATQTYNTLGGGTAPNPAFSPTLGYTLTGQPTGGYDTTLNNRSYSNSFGDKKGLDLWTYFPSAASISAVNIIAPLPQLPLVKRITAVNTTPITTLLDYMNSTAGSNADDDNRPMWPNLTGTATKSDGSGTTTNFSNFLQGTISSSSLTLRPKDELEFTIYFLSGGGQAANNASICDFIPANTTYVDGSLRLFRGNNTTTPISDATGDADGGAYPIGTLPASLPSACHNPALNTGRGAIVVNLGNLPNATNSGTPNTSYGYIRFRATVN
jgi:uncharacterized repeat protein (TIGR01451 family)